MDEEKRSQIEFEISLIDEVYNHKLLYDKSAPSFRDKKMRDKIWLDISEKLGKPVCECEGRWTTLRQRFTRELKKRECPSDSGSVINDTWLHYKRLLFLTDHIKPRPTASNFLEASVDSTDITFSPSNSRDKESSETPPLYKRRKANDRYDEILAEEAITLRSVDNDGTNEWFLRSIASMINDLPQHAQDLARMEVLKVVNELRRKYLHHETKESIKTDEAFL